MLKDPYRLLLRLKQNGSMMEYIDWFEKVSGPMRDIDLEILKGIFINGLKETLRAEVKSLGLVSLEEMRDSALLLEERNKEWIEAGVMMGDKKSGLARNPHTTQMGFSGKGAIARPAS